MPPKWQFPRQGNKAEEKSQWMKSPSDCLLRTTGEKWGLFRMRGKLWLLPNMKRWLLSGRKDKRCKLIHRRFRDQPTEKPFAYISSKKEASNSALPKSCVEINGAIFLCLSQSRNSPTNCNKLRRYWLKSWFPQKISPWEVESQSLLSHRYLMAIRISWKLALELLNTASLSHHVLGKLLLWVKAL